MATYSWQGADNGDWTLASNWTPTRTTPLTSDILQFNDGTTKTITALPTQTIGQLLLSNSTKINLQATAPVTLTISDSVGMDLDIPFGCSLNLNAVNAILINLPVNSSASISGSVSFSSTALTAHKLTGTDVSSITFNAGATFTAGTFLSGNPFGASNLNSVVFASGSIYIAIAGGNPFGATQPASVLVFQTGSLYKVNANVTPALSGRYYSDVEINYSDSDFNSAGGSAFSIKNLTITCGKFNINMIGSPGHSITGNISILTGATLTFTPTSSGSVSLDGTTTQNINNLGTLTFGSNSTIVINNPSGVILNGSETFNNLTLTKGIITTNTLTISGVTNGGSSTSYINGKLTCLYNTAAQKIFHIGIQNNYRPVTVNFTSINAPSRVTVEQTESTFSYPVPANVTLFTNRFWTITQTGSTSFLYDITFDETGFLPVSSVVILKNIIGAESTSTFIIPKFLKGRIRTREEARERYLNIEYQEPLSEIISTSGPPSSYTATGLSSFGVFGLGEN